jgi:hypothetical protein
VPPLTDAPIAFQANRAYVDAQTVAEKYPQRVAGSKADADLATWLVETLGEMGLETHVRSFKASIDGRTVVLENVWAVSKGASPGSILVLANRDAPPSATQGADDNASGVAVALELARTFTAAPHDRSIVFLFTDGDAYGALGARDYVLHNDTGSIVAAIALRRVGLSGSSGFTLDGWSTSTRVAPPWLWLLADSAARSTAGVRAILPGVFTQMLRLAVPSDAGSQGPFVAAGVPAITISARGSRPAARADVFSILSKTALGRSGGMTERLIATIDANPQRGERSGTSLFLSHFRRIPGAVVELALAAFILPVLLVALDLYAHNRRRRAPLSPTWMRYALNLAPWLVMLVIVYLANLLGLLPHLPGAVIPPESLVAQHPHVLRVLLLLAALAVVYWYALVVERSLARRLPIDRESTVFVAHAALASIAVLVLLVNPFSLLLIVPAAVLWPLARPGSWMRSLLPVWAGLAFIVVATLFYAVRLHLGTHVWWYFFLLFENRSVPGSAAVLGLAFVAAAAMLSATLRSGAWEPAAGQAMEKRPRRGTLRLRAARAGRSAAARRVPRRQSTPRR